VTGGGRWKPPSSEVPGSPRPEYLATLWTEHRATHERGMITVAASDAAQLDRRIVLELGNVRARGHRPVKTEMTIDGEEWIYEYDSTGHIERTFRNGDVTP
jgi:hypothetical protein